MFIKGKEFADGKLIIYKDYDAMEKQGSDMPFYICDVCIFFCENDAKISVLNEINFYVGTEFSSIEELYRYLNVDPDEIECEIV